MCEYVDPIARSREPQPFRLYGKNWPKVILSIDNKPCDQSEEVLD